MFVRKLCDPRRIASAPSVVITASLYEFCFIGVLQLPLNDSV